MFETMLESARPRRSWRRAASIPVAIAIHAALLLIAVSASYFVMQAVAGPPMPLGIDFHPPGLPPGAGESQLRQLRATQPTPEPPRPEAELEQPSAVPEVLPDAAAAAPEIGDGLPPAGTGAGEGIPGLEGLGTGSGGSGWTIAPAPGPLPDPERVREYDGTMTAPVLVRRVVPEYPEIAVRTRTQGTVELAAVIDQAGNVIDVEVVRSIRLLDDAAIEAVRQWRYTPATLGGQPVTVRFRVRVQFRLEP